MARTINNLHKYRPAATLCTLPAVTMVRVQVRDYYYYYNGLPPQERRAVRWAMTHLARSRHVTPLVVRRIDAERYSTFGLRIALFEGRRCVWIALAGICVIFELDEVKYAIVRRLRRRMYTWCR